MSNEERSTEGRKDTDLYFTHVISDAPTVALLLGHLYLEGHDPSITRVMLLRDGTFYFVYDLPDITYGATLLQATDEQPELAQCIRVEPAADRRGVVCVRHAATSTPSQHRRMGSDG